jgi:hypothetical protein
VIPTLTAEQIARFRAKLQPRGECVIWTGATSSKGYGYTRIGDRLYLAHRVAWAIEHGDPGELYVLHSCDTPPCVNVDHLFLGTHADNMQDMHVKSRGLSGERHPWTKVSDVQVTEIRERHAKGEPSSALAHEYGLGHVQIWRIVTRRVRTVINDNSPTGGDA